MTLSSCTSVTTSPLHLNLYSISPLLKRTFWLMHSIAEWMIAVA
jgi:hypothetical protein